MRLYVDTSVLASFYCRECGSAKAEKALCGDEPLALSNLVKLEFASAIAKKVRTGDFDKSFARQILSLFHSHLRDDYFEAVLADDRDVALADEWICSFATPLRTLDALHLAVTFNRGLRLLTADKVLAKSAGMLKVACHLL